MLNRIYITVLLVAWLVLALNEGQFGWCAAIGDRRDSSRTSTLNGNGKMVRTFRPITAFGKLTFGHGNDQAKSAEVTSLVDFEVNVLLSTKASDFRQVIKFVIR